MGRAPIRCSSESGVDDVFLGVAIADPLSLVLKVRRWMGEEFLGGDVDVSLGLGRTGLKS